MNFESIEKAPNDIVSSRRLSPTKDNSHPVERKQLNISNKKKLWIKLEHHQTTSIDASVCNTIDRYPREETTGSFTVATKDDCKQS